ncbi:hypothetical protein BH18THE2_BH18THE2_29430 [soil metagenome]
MCHIKIRQILEDGSLQQKTRETEGTCGLFHIPQLMKVGFILLYFLKNYHISIKMHGVKKGMVVYDPFMGIGTTALACISLGISYLCTEIDPEYIKSANEDIEKKE